MSFNYNYSLSIDLFDHTDTFRLFEGHSLLPHTETQLSERLDSALRSAKNLVHPQDIWQKLPHLPGPRHSEHTECEHGAEKHSQAQHSTTQQPILDGRFGPITVFSCDNPMSERHIAETPLHWGVIRLFRELGSSADVGDPSMEAATAQSQGANQKHVMACVCVPGNLAPVQFLNFARPALPTVRQVRILRDSSPSRTIVLLNFVSQKDAEQFRVMYNGKPYYDTPESETCQVVRMTHVLLKASNAPPYTFPMIKPGVNEDNADRVELPSCPVCLERLDPFLTGLMTLLCQHTFHCDCLLKWGDSRCPVCRLTHWRFNAASHTDAALTFTSDARPAKCAVCNDTQDLWSCLTCGHVGCGRYRAGHAYSHFAEQGTHLYALELASERIWDYANDQYVHRLIRDRVDGRLYEIPGLSGSSRQPRAGPSTSTSASAADPHDYAPVGGPRPEDDAMQSKIEAIGVEYTYLITSQLDAQRRYYEEELLRLREEEHASRRIADEASQAARRLRAELASLASIEAESSERHAELRRQLAAKERFVEQKVADAEHRLAARLDMQHKKDLHDYARRIEAAEKAARDAAAQLRKSRSKTRSQNDGDHALLDSMSANVHALEQRLAAKDAEIAALKDSQSAEIAALNAAQTDLKEQISDLMFALSAQDKLKGTEAAGGDISIVPR